MRLFLALSVLIVASTSLAKNTPLKFDSFGCVLSQTKATPDHQVNELYRCEVPALLGGTKNFYVMKLKSDFASNQYTQGYFLAPEIDQGSIREMILQRTSATHGMSRTNATITRKMISCFDGRVSESLSSEFKSGVDELARGYEQGMMARKKQPHYHLSDFEKANYGIEMANILYGISHRMHVSKFKAGMSALNSCWTTIDSSFINEMYDNFVNKAQDNQKFAGCIGMVAAGNATQDGALIHARNLDQSSLLFSWTQAPVVYLVSEPHFHKYVAVGTAGLIFPGGISGFNDQGIAVSLHQMNTTEYESHQPAGTAEVVPYLQQRILREASSIDEAFALIQKTPVIASWTVLISDSKKNEMASIEISPARKVIARRSTTVLGQSNHYLNPEMLKEHFHTRMGNYLETVSRLNYITERLNQDKGNIDLSWTVRTMSTHWDMIDHGPRSFGRVAVKASNLLSNIMIPKKNEFWTTLGDVQPGVHSQFLGFKIDFNSMNFSPIARTRTDVYADQPNYERSFFKYVEAFGAYKTEDFAKSESVLKEAIHLARLDGVFDYSYHYVLARVQMKRGEYMEANRNFKLIEAHRDLINDYTWDVIQMAKISNNDQLKALHMPGMGEYEREQILTRVLSDLEVYEKAKNTLRYGDDVQEKISIAHQWQKAKTSKERLKVKFQELDFGLAE